MIKSYIALSAIALIGVLTSPAFAQAKGRNNIGQESSDLLVAPSRWGGNWPKGVTERADDLSAADSVVH